MPDRRTKICRKAQPGRAKSIDCREREEIVGVSSTLVKLLTHLYLLVNGV